MPTGQTRYAGSLRVADVVTLARWAPNSSGKPLAPASPAGDPSTGKRRPHRASSLSDPVAQPMPAPILKGAEPRHGTPKP